MVLLGLMPADLGPVTFINNFLASTGVLLSIIPGLLQNGNSSLGLLPVPVLPPFLGGSGSGSSLYPWGNRTAGGTNAYNDPPDTGITRKYTLTIERGYLAPDGHNTSMLLINGQYPGPTLEADWGDFFEITVHNAIAGPEEGTALHWHGLLQKRTPWYDGVPGVSMCPIAPGESFTYRFQADLFGTSWYHSHYSAQYAGGLFGPMVIYGPTDNFPPGTADVEDLGPIILSDFFHRDYYSIIQDVVSNNPVKAELTLSDNTLIQGKGNSDCGKQADMSECNGNAGLAKFTVQRQKTYRLRLINTSAQAYFVVSLDGHEMTVVANDFVPIKPYTVNQVTLFVGQRIDVLVKADAKPGAYWFRIRQPILCALASQPFGLAAFYYDGINTTIKPESLPHANFISPTLIHCADTPLSATEPFYPIQPPEPEKTVHITIAQEINSTGHTTYTMNGQTFRTNYNHPLLNLTFNGNTSYPFDPQWNVYDFGSSESVRVVFQNTVPFAHPMHIHGQNMYVIDEGVGSWDGETRIRPQNPQRRDTQTLQPDGYLVVQLVSDNPGRLYGSSREFSPFY